MTGPARPAAEEADERTIASGARTGVVRVSTFRAKPGQVAGLVGAAGENAHAARQATGCLSADVCTSPDAADTVLVISHWESDSALRAFLDWHERHAHGAVSPYTIGVPRSVHYPVASRFALGACSPRGA